MHHPEVPHPQAHAAWLLLGSAVNRHPLLVIRAARWMLRHGYKHVSCRAYLALLAHLFSGPVAVERSRFGTTNPDADGAWAAELCKRGKPFTPHMVTESDCPPRRTPAVLTTHN